MGLKFNYRKWQKYCHEKHYKLVSSNTQPEIKMIVINIQGNTRELSAKWRIEWETDDFHKK